MVQKEIKRKTRNYALAAIFAAIILVSMIYTLGSPISPILNQSENQHSTGQNNPVNQVPNTPIVQELNGRGMKTFSSIEELEKYLNNTSHSMYYGPEYSMSLGGKNIPAPTSAPTATSSSTLDGTNGYSTTNIQVAGVDEADTVKTDGQYIYTVSSVNSQNPLVYYPAYYYSQTHNFVSITRADPSSPRVVSNIDLGNDTQQAQLYLTSDNSRLVIVGTKYDYNGFGYGSSVSKSSALLPPYFENTYTFIRVYDVSDKSNPVLTRNFTVTGNYFNSRMIGNYVYAVVSQSAMIYNENVTLPTIYNGKNAYPVGINSIYYANISSPYSFQFTSFFGINVLADNQQPTNMTVLMDGASTMYVSQDNIYVTYPTWTYANDFTYGQEYTSIYRVSINGAKLTFEAQGNVTGSTINQYSMDENNGYFRIATNSYGQTQTNNLYVLNANLSVVGKLEGLAKNENLHSVRFLGDKCYMVTFIKTDPLFVIDLRQPTAPKVLGELQISGYSDYLHPYDETHLIGVGKEAVGSDTGNFAWYQGIKLALFDVTDLNNPKQLSNYVIGDRGTDSLALSDPKSFLFSKATGLLVIPINLAKVDNSTGQATASSYGQTVWQGAYVFNVNLNEGFTLKGTITHLNETALAQITSPTPQSTGISSSPSTSLPSITIAPGNPYSIYTMQDHFITRTLYIGNTLYTISNAEIKLNNLTDLTQIAEINLT